MSCRAIRRSRRRTRRLDAALKTWDTTGKYKFWDIGGGGAPWNSFAYDPELDLVYFGTGNGNPWNRELRSPKGGDNLYLSSVVALHARTGEYAWHYQTTPGDTWDFDSTADCGACRSEDRRPDADTC